MSTQCCPEDGRAMSTKAIAMAARQELQRAKKIEKKFGAAQVFPAIRNHD
jgi:hypothetical protein